MEAQPATFIIPYATNTSCIKTIQSDRTVLVNHNQVAICGQGTNTTAGTSKIVTDKTPVQHENDEEHSPTPEDQSEPV